MTDQSGTADIAEAIRTATLWFEQQIENAKQDQITGFAVGPQVNGERAWARHCALYEAQQVFLKATIRPDVVGDVQAARTSEPTAEMIAQFETGLGALYSPKAAFLFGWQQAIRRSQRPVDAAQPAEQQRIDDAKRITSAVLNTMTNGGDNLAIYEAVWSALA